MNKFRIFNIKENKYESVNDFVISGNGQFYQISLSKYDGSVTKCKLEDYIIEPCLNLKDIRGTDIYEGDVLCKTVYSKIWINYPEEREKLERIKQESRLVNIEQDNDKVYNVNFIPLYPKYGTATSKRFPMCWLESEEMGYDYIGLEKPEEWLIMGNVHFNSNLIKQKE